VKKIICVLSFAFSFSTLAQERFALNSKSLSIPTDRAVIVRNAQTPDIVQVTFLVPMANSVCMQYATRPVQRICYQPERIYRYQRVCESRPIPAPRGPNGRGPRYNPPGHQVCRDVRVLAETRQLPYDCSYVESYCAQYGTNLRTETDRVRIKFKLPPLGGSEEQTFAVTARQKNYDGANVEYIIVPQSDNLEVVKKGILGYDSFVIREK
jgi:hypothetical protein